MYLYDLSFLCNLDFKLLEMSGGLPFALFWRPVLHITLLGLYSCCIYLRVWLPSILFDHMLYI
jgi:hypothetical protein